jgi:RNA polymerase sigma factor (sigma-70 family)
MKLSDDEFKRLWSICLMHAGKFGQTSLGVDDYVSSAFEKLLQMDEQKVPNPEAWLKLVITNMLINRANKLKHRPPTMRGLEPEQLEAIAIGPNKRSMSSQIIDAEVVGQILDGLSAKQKEMLVLDAAGFTTAEIAEELGYASAKVVATRIKQIRQEIKKSIDLG